MVREPLSGWQDDGLRGFALGVWMGGSGALLKPISGVLELCSKGLSGVGIAIRAWGDEVVRVPRTRIRSPRQFASTTGLDCAHSMLSCVQSLDVKSSRNNIPSST